MRSRFMVALGVITLVATAASAAPLAPPPPGSLQRATRIATPPTDGHVTDYAKLFATNVRAYDNGVLVAEGRDQWVAYATGPMSLGVRIMSISPGAPIISVEEVSNRSVFHRT